MKLEPEQESILRGESGKSLSLAMKTLVEYGKAFDARRMVDIKSGHLAGTFGVFSYKAYYNILERLVAENVKVKVPATINPRPGRELDFLNRVTFMAQNKLEKLLEGIGVTPNYSCVCYEGPNQPAFGDRLSWAESSAVQFANSALGARTNRNSILIDVCSAVTGFAPEFGYLLDENRRGAILVKLNISKMDPSALGFVIGQAVVDQVPVIEHFEIDRIGLKNMGGAMAAAGGVALFHIEGVTPEAPDFKTAFQGEPKKTITITQNDIDALRSKDPEDADLVVFGCPQMTFEEAQQLSQRFVKKRTKKPTWFCMIPEHLDRFKNTESYRNAIESGIEFYSHCPLAALTVQLKRKNILTSSGKCFYYLDGSKYGNLEDCLRACGAA